MFKKGLRYSFYSLALVVLVGHFALTYLHVSPPNPLKTLTNVDQLYLYPHFSQDWGLFAPDPISSDISVYYQCLLGDEGTPMLDASTSLWQARLRNPISPYDRLGRVASNYAIGLLNASRADIPYLQVCDENPDSPGCDVLLERQEVRHETQIEGLRRVGNAFCGDISNRTQQVYDAMHIWVAVTPVLRWSQRHTGEREPEFVDVGRHDIAELSAFGIWR